MPAVSPRPLAAFAALLVVVASIAACAATSVVTGPREWKETTELPDGTKVEIIVRDESGRLANAEIDPQDAQVAADISNPAGQPNVVLVPWTGGACDVQTVFTFKAAGQGLSGNMATTTGSEVCTMMAIQHQLRLTSGEPLPAAQVTFSPAP